MNEVPWWRGMETKNDIYDILPDAKAKHEIHWRPKLEILRQLAGHKIANILVHNARVNLVKDGLCGW